MTVTGLNETLEKKTGLNPIRLGGGPTTYGGTMRMPLHNSMKDLKIRIQNNKRRQKFSGTFSPAPTMFKDSKLQGYNPITNPIPMLG